MKSIVPDEKNTLVWKDSKSLREISSNEIIVKTAAAGVNRADLLQRAGKYPPPAGESEILGLEVSGVVEQVGSAVSKFKKGDKVCTLLAGGGYATHVLVHEDTTMPVPKGFSLVEAAALPEAYLTAYLNLFIEGGLKQGERVLVHGGGSGVGLAAVQLASFFGCEVFTTAGADEKLSAATKAGAKIAINYRKDDFAEVISEGVDLILDINGAGYLEKNISILRTKGRLVIIALMGGAAANLNLRSLLSKRLTVKGSTLRARAVEEKREIIEGFTKTFWSALECGKIRPIIDSTYPITSVEEAHKKMSENRNIGKIVLTV